MIVGLCTNWMGEWGKIEVCNWLPESSQGMRRGPRCLLHTQESVVVSSPCNDSLLLVLCQHCTRKICNKNTFLQTKLHCAIQTT